jgi:hypothetical protein
VTVKKLTLWAANLVGVVDVAGERRADDVRVLVDDLDDVRAHLVRLVLDDRRVRTVVHVQVEKLAWGQRCGHYFGRFGPIFGKILKFAVENKVKTFKHQMP